MPIRSAVAIAALMIGVAGSASAAAAADGAGADSLQTAVLSGGCFWGMQGVYEHVRGVHQVLAGYAGGEQATAHYEMVGTGTTGHAESIQITFDPAVVSYADLLQIFFSVAHDPTELNRQGPDSGPQYRSEIFYANAQQQKTAVDYIAQLNQSHTFRSRIVTRVDALKGFYPAEHYHQDFLVHNPRYPYIVYNDLPKIENLKKEFPQQYVDTPVLVAAAR
ncbi:MAG TPA: peptide-methionine (S)-S-oxide reductase MsrA [Steroidobacteraceae bacterium]|jgi:peptide-methionine (S)-S-oxide reductase